MRGETELTFDERRRPAEIGRGRPPQGHSPSARGPQFEVKIGNTRSETKNRKKRQIKLLNPGRHAVSIPEKPADRAVEY